MRRRFFYLLFAAMLAACGGGGGDNEPVKPDPKPDPDPNDNTEEVKYDETLCHYKSYKGLLMCGYQGWFAAEGDGLGRGWYHYTQEGKLQPGFISIDCWPDMSEYEHKYAAPGFQFADGSQAYLYSAQDEQTVDLHFKWMKEYGIDGVFMQRFVSQTVNIGKTQFNKVLSYALKAAKKYDRAIAIMYDGHIGTQADYDAVTKDWDDLVATFKLFDPAENPTFLRHNGKPVFSFWGIGLSDRRFEKEWFEKMCEHVKGSKAKKTTLMFGMPYYWREQGNDCTKNAEFLPLMKKWCDIVMPWAVGRYRNNNVDRVRNDVFQDKAWCDANKMDYVPVAFPGFSWANMYPTNPYDDYPRLKGDFLWQQVAYARMSGAEMQYIAMFDEMDEATCIFKCLNMSKVPLNGANKFIGYEDDVKTDHYLWLAGEAAKWIHGATGYSRTMPVRP